MVADLNVTMKWLSYPGRKSGVSDTEDLVFAAAGGKA